MAQARSIDLAGTARALVRDGLGMPLVALAMLSMMLLPLPPLLLDALFTFNISISLVVMLAVVYVMRPLDLAAFPTVLLIATLLRLGLNVASTRVVLLNGHSGSDAAGKVIEAFGQFVIGGNYAVGFVIFAILVIINFVVVTKGAGRVSEVSARFTLDALPGKQMAIDADLNAGIISQEDALARRVEVRAEADFYGAMDGASKFVRGDAVAGILILFINLIGGMVIGTVQHDLPLAQAAQTYALLTIGDGLVAQIPSLLLSTAVAVIVTRMSRSEDMGRQLVSQLFADRRVLRVVSGLLAILGLVPGMPNLVFLSMAAAAGALAWRLDKGERAAAENSPAEPPPEDESAIPVELSWDDVGEAEMIALDVGYRLIPLVDRAQNGELMRRITGVRKRLSEDLGFLVSPVRIRDDLDLAPCGYRISLSGATVASEEIFVDRELAIDPGHVATPIDGIEARDPAFGLEARWIDPASREEAQALGYTVVDPATVVATHLSKLLTDHSDELLGYQETQELLDRLARSAPRLVEELVPKVLPLSVVVHVLRTLLREGVPVTSMRTICQALAEAARTTQEPDVLVAAARVALGRSIVQRLAGSSEEVPVMTLDPSLEKVLAESVQAGVDGGPIEPGLAEKLQESLKTAAQTRETNGEPAILLVAGPLRAWLAQFLRHAVPALRVLAYNEIPDDRSLRLVAAIGV